MKSFVNDSFIQVARFLSFAAIPSLIFIPSGALIVLLILLLSIVGISLEFNRGYFHLDNFEKFFILSFVIYFLIVFISVLLNSGQLRDLDTASRFILVLPIFLYFRRNRIGNQVLLYGLYVTAILFVIETMFLKFLQISFLGFEVHIGILSLYGGIIGTTLVFSLSDHNSKIKNYLIYIIAILTLVSSISWGGRGVWLALLPTMLLLIKLKYQLKKIIAGIVFLTTLIVVSFFISPLGIEKKINDTYDELSMILANNTQSASIGRRVELIKVSLDIFKENKLIGIGENQFKSKIDNEFEIRKWPNEVKNINHPHNELMASLVEQGITGLASLLMVLIYPIYYAINLLSHNKNNEKETLLFFIITIVVMYFFYGFTNGIFDHQNTTTFFASMLAITFGIVNYKED